MGLAELLRRWDDYVVQDRRRTDPPWVREVEQGGTVLRPPATAEQIRDAEGRLGVRLPDWYREFLLLSNGAHASTIGADRAGGDRHGFVPVEEVVHLRDVDPRWIEMWSSPDFVDRGHRPAPGQPTDVDFFVPAAAALLVSRPLDAMMDLLVPVDGGESWEFWTTYKEGATAYVSLADALERELDLGERRQSQVQKPNRSDLEQRLTSTTQNEWQKAIALIDLAELDAGATSVHAARILGDPEEAPQARYQAARLLGRLAELGEDVDLSTARAVSANRDDSHWINAIAALAHAGDASAYDELRRLSTTGADERTRALASSELEQIQAIK